MALGKILMGCGLLLMLSSQQSFVPAAFGKQEAPRPELSTARPMDMAQGVETSAPSSASSFLPLAGGLALGLALVLPQRAMAATGNDDVGTLVDRLFTKEALGAFGIAGLSWNTFYLLFGLSGVGIIGLAVILTVFLPPPRTLKDKA